MRHIFAVSLQRLLDQVKLDDIDKERVIDDIGFKFGLFKLIFIIFENTGKLLNRFPEVFDEENVCFRAAFYFNRYLEQIPKDSFRDLTRIEITEQLSNKLAATFLLADKINNDTNIYALGLLLGFLNFNYTQQKKKLSKVKKKLYIKTQHLTHVALHIESLLISHKYLMQDIRSLFKKFYLDLSDLYQAISNARSITKYYPQFFKQLNQAQKEILVLFNYNLEISTRDHIANQRYCGPRIKITKLYDQMIQQDQDDLALQNYAKFLKLRSNHTSHHSILRRYSI